MAQKAPSSTEPGDNALASIKPSDLPAPPQEALEVMRACADENYDSRAVADMVVNDPLLTAELLRVVNSPLYGLSREVDSIARAVTILGQRALRNLVLCIAVRDVLARNAIKGMDITGFWEDTLRRASGARLLGARAGLEADACFTTGLLQDFGLLGLFYIYPEHAPAWPDLRVLDPEARAEAERARFGTTHDAVLGLLAEAWSLPDEMARVLGAHHRCGELASGASGGLCAVLHCADWMAAAYSAADAGAALEGCRSRLQQQFALDHEAADELLGAIPEQVNQAAAALGLRVRHAGDFDQVVRQANARLAEENLSFQEITWELRKALKERDRLAAELDRELALASEIQQSLLPSERAPGMPVFGINVPAQELSGDFYDYFALPDGRIYFNLADVSGKGITAALLMAKASSLFHCLGKAVHSPVELVQRINDELCETSRYGMFVTLAAGIYDPASGKLRVVNAGHPPALVIDDEGNSERIQAHGPPLGIAAGTTYSEQEVDLRGRSLYLFSDGISEAIMEHGRMLGIAGVEDMARALAGHPPDVRLRTIVKRVSDARPERRDDMTLLLVEGVHVR
jgi:sigma-B regulation protein RsbU (phosphoserine phosphatase)